MTVCCFSLPKNVCLVIVFVCFRKFYFMTSSSILRILLKPQLNFILFNFNFLFFFSVGSNSVCIELFVNTGYFINVFFVYKLNRRRGVLKHGLWKCGFCSERADLKLIIGLFCVLDFYLSHWKKLTIQVNCFTHLACYVIPL